MLSTAEKMERVNSMKRNILDEAVKDSYSLAATSAIIEKSLKRFEAISQETVKCYNELVYKVFPTMQRGAEFEKEETEIEKSRCPKAVAPADYFDFGAAIRSIKQGYRCARKGWNGKGQYIELATELSYRLKSHGPAVTAFHEDIGSKAIAFVGTSGIQIGWLASQADMLAEDWYIVKGD